MRQAIKPTQNQKVLPMLTLIAIMTVTLTLATVFNALFALKRVEIKESKEEMSAIPESTKDAFIEEIGTVIACLMFDPCEPVWSTELDPSEPLTDTGSHIIPSFDDIFSMTLTESVQANPLY